MAGGAGTYTVLAVDDEPGILNVLTRQLRKTPFELLTANSGQEALDILAGKRCQIIVSDMRMPGMNGAEFLAEVRQRHPETVRLLLTGYSDMDATVQAINDGGIFSYLAKPWEPESLLQLLDSAARHYQSRRNKNIKLIKISRHAQSLKQKTEDLESRLAKSRQDAEQTSAFIDMAKKEVEQAYDTAVEVFANLIDLRIPGETGINREVAQVASFLAFSMGLSPEEQRSIRLAGMLYNVGKIGLPRDILETPFGHLNGAQSEQFKTYPRLGETALLALTPLQATIQWIVLHRETLDGSGFPVGLSATALPLAARILAVSVAFRERVKGRLDGQVYSELEALKWLQSLPQKFDSDVVDILACLVGDGDEGEAAEITQQEVEPYALQPGMRLASDLYASNGMLLLSAGQALTSIVISKLVGMTGQLVLPIRILVDETEPDAEDEAPAAGENGSGTAQPDGPGE